MPGQEAGTSVNRSSVPATTSGLGEERRLPAASRRRGPRQWAFVPGVGGLSRCAALAQSPGLSLHAGQGAGKSRRQGSKASPRQSQPRRWGHRAVPSLQGHTVHRSEAGHQPAMPASQSCGRRCPPCGRGLTGLLLKPTLGGSAERTPSSLLSLPLSHPHPEGAQLEVTSPPGASPRLPQPQPC